LAPACDAMAECHGVCSMLHTAAMAMSPAEMDLAPPGITRMEYSQHVCQPHVGVEPVHYEADHEDDHECYTCHDACATAAPVEDKHDQIQASRECVECDSCHHALMSGCVGVFGHDDMDCHHKCDGSPACGVCHAEHEAVWREYDETFWPCVDSCDSGVCAADGSVWDNGSADVYVDAHPTMDECVDCHRSCNDEECGRHCDTVCGRAKADEGHDASHTPVPFGGSAPMGPPTMGSVPSGSAAAVADRIVPAPRAKPSPPS